MLLKLEQQKRISKRLSLHLRHEPESLGLQLERGGWVGVDTLITTFSSKYFPITREDLEQVVAGNDKPAICLRPDGNEDSRQPRA